MLRSRMAICVMMIALCQIGFAQQRQDLGSLSFPTSGSPEAQEHFLLGVLLLHSFEYPDASEAFLAAQAADPGFAMAYWGEAMSHNHPIWMRQNREAANAALRKFGSDRDQRQAKTPTERERDYLNTVEVLFGEGDKKSRDFAYVEAMKALHEKYPDDLEAASFYALALLGTAHSGRDFTIYMKAASVVEEVFAKNPMHPGAAHYLIHSYDDPVHAPLGLRAARVYAKIAPAASHALHMPSHIFVAMGMWEDVVASNIDSWEAAEARVRRKNLSLEDRGYHALWWLLYGYLQQGRLSKAMDQLAIIEKDTEKSGSSRTRYHLTVMRAAYLIDSQDWTGAASRIKIKTENMDLRAATVNQFAIGFSAAKTNNLAAARTALEAIQAKRDSEKSARAAHKKAAEIMENELAAVIAFAEGRTEEGLAKIEEAAGIEDGLPFQFGPPIPVKPAHELYGELLLSIQSFKKAREQFELALNRAPDRALSLMGLAKALARTGDKDAAERVYKNLMKVRNQSDQQLPTLRDLSLDASE